MKCIVIFVIKNKQSESESYFQRFERLVFAMEFNVSKEITCKWQVHFFMLNKIVSQRFYETLKTKKKKLWKKNSEEDFFHQSFSLIIRLDELVTSLTSSDERSIRTAKFERWLHWQIEWEWLLNANQQPRDDHAPPLWGLVMKQTLSRSFCRYRLGTYRKNPLLFFSKFITLPLYLFIQVLAFR